MIDVKCAGCGRDMGSWPRQVVITCSRCVARARNIETIGNPVMRSLVQPSRHERRRAGGVSRSRAGR